MPVEIKELVIKLKVEENNRPKAAAIDKKALKEDIAVQVRQEVQKQLKKMDER
jgi:hypothetical protein